MDIVSGRAASREVAVTPNADINREVARFARETFSISQLWIAAPQDQALLEGEQVYRVAMPMRHLQDRSGGQSQGEVATRGGINHGRDYHARL